MTGSSTVSALAHALKLAPGHRLVTLNSTPQATQLLLLTQSQRLIPSLLLSLNLSLLSTTNTKTGAEIIRIRASAIMIALAITRGQLMTLTSGCQSTKLAGAYPSKECPKAINTVRMSARNPQLARAMVVMIADGAGLMIVQTGGSLLNPCVVASQLKRRGNTVMSAQHSTIWTVAPTALTASGRGHP